MSARVLVAGIGNVFLGDDGFGVEVARRLATSDLPPGTIVRDIGVRGLHLAYELLDPVDLLVIVDLAPRGGEPGTLYLIEPELTATPRGAADAHAMDVAAVLAAVRALGGSIPRVRIVGCEPAHIGDGMSLSEPVSRAVGEAVSIVRELVVRAHAPCKGSTARGPSGDGSSAGREKAGT